MPTKHKFYDPQAMATAIEMVRAGTMSEKKASIIDGVPRKTLLEMLAGRVPEEDTRPGPHTGPKKAEEKTLVNKINLMAEIGYPLTRDELLKEVKCILDTNRRNTPFAIICQGRGGFTSLSHETPKIRENTPATWAGTCIDY